MSERLNRCYAGWLGKLAGIRMGAPVEGWEYAKIKETYGELNGYIGDLSHFRADDDSNGPLIFIRAMNDFSIDPTSEEIGKTWLNYTSWQHGMFWWGGYGVSTEHTAYMNLAAGIPAPPKRQHRPERQNRGRADRRTDFHRSLGPGVPRPSRQGGGTGPAL